MRCAVGCCSVCRYKGIAASSSPASACPAGTLASQNCCSAHPSLTATPCSPAPAVHLNGTLLQWEEWDVRRSLFDNHESSTMEENLEYMFKNFGFYFPDSQYLTDPEGLLKYLVS